MERHREIVREYLDRMGRCVQPLEGGAPGFGRRYAAAGFDAGGEAAYDGYYEKVAPSDELAVSRGDISIAGRSRQRLLGDDMLRVRLSIAGEGRFEGLAQGGATHFGGRSCTLVDQAPGADLAQITEADSRHCGITLLIPRFLLSSAWGLSARHLPGFFKDFEQQDQREARALSMPLGAELLWATLEILRCQLTGDLLDLYLKGKAKEILSLLMQELSRESSPAPAAVALRSRDIALLNEARRLVAERFTRPPSLAELAATVGMNRNKLCVGFKRLFGRPVFDYCRELRMQQALELLRQGDAPLARIAWRLGYQHAPAFSAAFKKRFGCSPKDCRDKGDFLLPPLAPPAA